MTIWILPEYVEDVLPAEARRVETLRRRLLDLFEVRPGTSGAASTLTGGFGINSAGKLVFTTDITKFAAGSIELR